jgi:alkylhydroperoxidase family enzyme
MSPARIPAAPITGPFGALVKTFSRKKLGKVPDSLGVMWHHRRVLTTLGAMGGKTQKWNACDPGLKSIAHMAVAAKVGCSFCLDFGYFQAHNERLDLDKAREVPN